MGFNVSNCDVIIHSRLANGVKPKKYFKVSLRSFSQKGKTNLQILNKKNKAAEEYMVSDNVDKFHHNFLHSQGKATIEFINPSISCAISTSYPNADSFRKLQHFLSHTLRSQIPNSVFKKHAAHMKQPIKFTEQPIMQPLEEIYKGTLPGGNWNNVIRLDLSGLEQCEFPSVLSQLQVLVLNLAGNNLGYSSEPWKWIRPPLTETLNELNLSNNNLKCLPANVQRFWNLRGLDLSSNLLRNLPYSLCDGAKSLSSLILTGNDLLENIPLFHKSFSKLNVSANAPLVRDNDRLLEPSRRAPRLQSLFEAAARVLLRFIPLGIAYHKWLFSSPALLPENVRDRLDNYLICICGKRIIGGFSYCKPKLLSSLATVTVIDNRTSSRTYVMTHAVRCERCLYFMSSIPN